MPRFKLYIEYQGTRYSGWQLQKNSRTVQGEILRTIERVTGESGIEFQGAGRTDAGVHALAQVAHLDLKKGGDPEALRRAFNDDLPSDIHILRVQKAPARFHARHDAIARSYLYQLARRRTAFGKKLVWWVKEDLNLDRVRDAAQLFVGMRDFESFSASDDREKSTKVLVEQVEVGEVGDLVLIRVRGSHFLWKMVRRIVGVLVEVGKGQLDAEDVKGFLGSKSPRPAELTAPASGLFLERVYYPGDTFLQELKPVISLVSP